jgi:hypothetical protein
VYSTTFYKHEYSHAGRGRERGALEEDGGDEVCVLGGREKKEGGYFTVAPEALVPWA